MGVLHAIVPLLYLPASLAPYVLFFRCAFVQVGVISQAASRDGLRQSRLITGSHLPLRPKHCMCRAWPYMLWWEPGGTHINGCVQGMQRVIM